MNEQKLLKECLDKAVREARLNKNILSENKYKEIFDALELSNSQLGFIAEYLEGKNVKILNAEEIEILNLEAEKEDDLSLDDEDKTAIDFYYEEIRQLKIYEGEELHLLKQKAIEGDENAQQELVRQYLPQVIDIAKLYAGQEVLIEDLISEGNMALVLGSQIAGCIDSPDEVDGHMGKLIMDSMDALVENEKNDEQLIIKLGKDLKKKEKKAEK